MMYAFFVMANLLAKRAFQRRLLGDVLAPSSPSALRRGYSFDNFKALVQSSLAAL